MTKRSSPILLLIFLSNLIPNVLCAAEMSSKRDCVLCHIMWMDDFRTNRETLIEWQPENTLMKDTQGVVSSQEICYSCHDGYVVDSRAEVWENNQHKTFVKPSANTTIPSTLTLSSKDEIYCGTCHSAHGAGAAPSGASSGQTSFFREKNEDSGLCETCHKNESEFKRTKSHPLHSSKLRIPSNLFSLGAVKAKDNNSVICQSCHKTHGAAGKKITILDNANSGLCISCHEKKRKLFTGNHDLRKKLPHVKNFKEQSLTEFGSCSACHTPHNALSKKLWSRASTSDNPASGMCLSCHGNDSGFNIKKIGKYSHPVNVTPKHVNQVSAKLPMFLKDLEIDSTGKIHCMTCHDIHQWYHESELKSNNSVGNRNIPNNYLRIQNSDSSPICYECHRDKASILNSDHNLIITAPDEKNINGYKPIETGLCSACHIPHNAASRRLWGIKLFSDKDMVSQFCTGCHNEKGAAKEKQIGKNYHPVDISLNTVSNNNELKDIQKVLPLYSDEGIKVSEGKMVCLTCHEPHIWRPGASSQTTDYPKKNIEGDTSSSFLRKANYPYSDLCKVCHKDNAFVDGTDHDLTVTAPLTVNILGQTVKESGPCGACHLVHNCPNELKLWARPYIRISKDENIMNTLCKSCHSKGEMAEAKVPKVATHPQGKLITNVMAKKKEGYTPVFDNKGMEKDIGDISCPSCHNAHQWSPIFKKKGLNKNLDGSIANMFLRTTSDNTVCIDCHGPEAIYRYQYFHIPEKRKIVDRASPGNQKKIKK